MTPYRGRFAPSPTGPLHLGSLFAALVSYLEAKKNAGSWLLRIEDIDPLRETPDASKLIIDALEAHQLFWDEDAYFQSQHSLLYEKSIASLEKHNAILRCPCSRKELNALQGQHTEDCRQQRLAGHAFALKFKHTHDEYVWHDLLQGTQKSQLDEDFVLKRKEGFYAYQLAVVTDDIEQSISHVVRGYDLLSSTPMQLALYKALQHAPPQFSHFPVLAHSGQKLSKQNLSKAINPLHAKENLFRVLTLLNLDLAAKEKSITNMLNTAIDLWQPQTLAKQREIALTSVDIT